MSNEFSWERYQAGEKVQRRDGLEVLNVYRNDNADEEYFKIAYVHLDSEGCIDISHTNINGKYLKEEVNADDLIMAPRIEEYWIAISRGSCKNGNRLTTCAYLDKDYPSKVKNSWLVKVRINLDMGEQVE